MSPVLENGIVVLIVGGCALHLARVVYRSARRFLSAKRGSCGGCGSCGTEARARWVEPPSPFVRPPAAGRGRPR